MTARTIKSIEAALIQITVDFAQRYTVSQLSISRTQEMTTLTKQYRNDDLLDLDVLAEAVKAMQGNDEVLLAGSVLRDGVIYPQIEDDTEYQAMYLEVEEALKQANPAETAMWAFIFETVNTGYLQAKQAA
jgi:hypothetical protein